MAQRKRVTQRNVTRADHLKFCNVEGWEDVPNARGKPTSHHITKELKLPDGRILRTRISRPAAKKHVYGKSILNHILEDQLQVTLTSFWDCVNGDPPDRNPDPAAPELEGERLPANLVWQLRKHVQVPVEEIATMTREEASRRVQEYWRNLNSGDTEQQ
ncbi:MAG: hypothetical protein V9E98_06350 [Candidatus Nanopelagicales bacterium]